MSNRDIIETLLTALIDTSALLEHYAQGRPLNWDGSTKQQALAQLRANTTFISFIKSEGYSDE